MNLKIFTEPTEEPISLYFAKLHLRVDSNAEDSIITDLIIASRRLAEKFTSRVFITQTWDLFLDEFPQNKRKRDSDWWDGVREGPISFLNQALRSIDISRSPLQSVTFLKTFDDSNTEFTFAASNYFVDVNSEPGRLSLKTGVVWPTTILRPTSGIQIQFVAGYGLTATVPREITQAMFIMITHLYEHRGDGIEKMPSNALMLLDKYRLKRII